MLDDPKFLFDHQLIAALENLIKSAKKELILVSPYIDLDSKTVSVLKEKRELKDFKIIVLFGKNESDFMKSMKPESLKFLMEFPNIEIKHEPRLHAKYYRNEFECLFSSLNLYNYSVYNNIEFGIKYKFDYKGLFAKAIGAVDHVIAETVDKVKENVFGSEAEIDPVFHFDGIVENANLLYKTEPMFTKSDGLKGVLGRTKLDGFKVKVDLISNLIQKPLEPKSIGFLKDNNTGSNQPLPSPSLLSATALAKEIGVSGKQIKAVMEEAGFLQGDNITELGKSNGIQLLSGKYGEYIAYPENIKSLLKRMNEL